MTDIKERLRAVSDTVLQPGSKMPSWMAHTAQDALAEIERLESAIVMRKAAFEAVKDDSIAFASENVSLRAERDALRASNERMEAALRAVADLINDSYGVSGLHLNGDVAPWDELRTGGRYEEWLVAFDTALSTSQPVETDEERDHRRAKAVYDHQWYCDINGHPYPEGWAVALDTARAIAESDKAQKERK